MNIQDFKIKDTFLYNDDTYLCCDIGSRSVVCINLQRLSNSSENPEILPLTLVLDNNFHIVYRDYNDKLESYLSSQPPSYIPIVDSFKIFYTKQQQKGQYPYPRLLEIRRYFDDAIIVPYSAIFEKNNWKICYFNHLTNQHLFASEEEILNMPILTNEKKDELLEKVKQLRSQE